MYGSLYGRIAHGRWDHVGTMNTSGLPSGFLHRKFTLVDVQPGNEFAMVLSSGSVRGFIVHDIDDDGLLSLRGQLDYRIGKLDNPEKRGVETSVRVMDIKSQLEAEGLGAALPGNLVCTTGPGAIDGSTTFMKELTAFNGCLREASTGDVVVGYFHRLLTPEADPGNVRILWEWAGGMSILA